MPDLESRMSIEKREDDLTENESKSDMIPVPASQRHCTDVVFLLIFVAYLLGMGVISFISLASGDPNRLIFGSDNQGNLCGVEDFADRRFLAFPRVEEDVLTAGSVLDGDFGSLGLSQFDFFGVCVASCPLAGDYVCTDAAETRAAELVVTTGLTRDQLVFNCDASLGLTCEDTLLRDGCFDTIFDTTDVFFRCLPEYVYEVEVLPESRCIRFKNYTSSSGDLETACVAYREVTKVTREQPTASNLLFDSFNSYSVIVQSYMGDLVRARVPIIASGVGVSAFVGLIYIFSLWCCVSVVVWASVVGAVVMSICFTLYCYIKAGILSGTGVADIYSDASNFLEDASEVVASNLDNILNVGINGTLELPTFDNETALPSLFTASLDYQSEYTKAAYLSSALTIILCIVVFALFPRILRAIEIFEEASKAIRHNVLITIIPFLSMLTMGGVVAVWAYLTAHVATAGDFSAAGFNQTISLTPDAAVVDSKVFGTFSYANVFVVYNFFGLLWILNFINAITTMTISGAVLQWFWNDEIAKDDESKSRHSAFPLLKSLHITVRYHLGTVAFGSFILALVTFIRYLAAWMQRRMNSLGKDNKAVRIIFCALQCFLRCVQKCVEFLSTNGFIYCAMYGTPFCTSTKTAFVAAISNIAQVATVTFLGDLIQRFGQVLISFSAALICWVWIDSDESFAFGGEHQLYSNTFPVLITALLAWFTAAEVLAAYHITVTTILLSYLQDKRLAKYKTDHKETRHNHKGLTSFFHKHELKDPKLIRQASLSTIH